MPTAQTLADQVAASRQYCNSLTHPTRLLTREVQIGDTPVGGANPIRIQSMTTTDTLDTEGTVAQAIRMIEAGCEYVRVTAPSKKEAENLKNIREALWKHGYKTPLVADIHFTPNAAEIAARYVEKVRVNPGNYADKKKFEFIEYTDEAYQSELQRIYERFSPLVKQCKELGRAMRIGTNHGSLSDRIMSRYGDTPEGMVASALEFIDICEDHGYYDLVVSMKASNAQVMVQAYRLLAARMQERGNVYPLHLGVTEAGDGEDGRIKSALGIGALLADGLGDTVRVSLTEPPENEMPVGRYLVRHYEKLHTLEGAALADLGCPIDPYHFTRRHTQEVLNLGGENVPRVIAHLPQPLTQEQDLLPLGHYFSVQQDKWSMTDLGVDWVYPGDQPLPFMLPNGVKTLLNAAAWATLPEDQRAHRFPFFASSHELEQSAVVSNQANFVALTSHDLADPNFDYTTRPHVIWVLTEQHGNRLAAWRNVLFQLYKHENHNPVVLRAEVRPDAQDHTQSDHAKFSLSAACEGAQLLVDGMVDGLWLVPTEATPLEVANRTAFGMLQAARQRITKTEYISCPSCGRTLFDLEETTARIRKRTEHLKGVKIGIMGCIVNGPGEMADADYGYVGSGPDQITLYKGQEVVRRNVKTAEAVDALIDIIREHGDWLEPAEAQA